MTTQVTVSTNGRYVSEGKITVTNDGNSRDEEFKVGPGNNVQKSFHVPHGSSVVLEIVEREATDDEAAQAAAEGNGSAVGENRTRG